MLITFKHQFAFTNTVEPPTSWLKPLNLVLVYCWHISYRFTKIRMGSVINLLVISSISCGRVAEMRTT